MFLNLEIILSFSANHTCFIGGFFSFVDQIAQLGCLCFGVSLEKCNSFIDIFRANSIQDRVQLFDVDFLLYKSSQDQTLEDHIKYKMKIKTPTS